MKTNFEAFEEDATRKFTSIQASVQQNKVDVESANRKFTSIQALVQQNKADVELANQKVIFSAVRETGKVAAGTIITYNKLVTNVGDGMDINSGRFTAPLTGIYHFSFNGLTDDFSHYIFIEILKNDVQEFIFQDSNNSNNYNTHESLSYSWTMVLRENDRVHLRVRGPKGLFVSGNSPVWFNGHLLKQQV